ncbi:hypothetical protein ACFWN5_31230 [Streptomyces sp. NPDC058430]|uniref:hypothetical protein n=1 Tax=Streptomyces sp. NPDC058430 TaxID=3346495 RepID=UPI0036683058
MDPAGRIRQFVHGEHPRLAHGEAPHRRLQEGEAGPCVVPAQPDALGLAAYTAARRPRTTAVARKAVAVGRVNMLSNRPAMALRNTLIAALDRTGPAVMLRGFDEIADWRPPQRPYAAQTQRV